MNVRLHDAGRLLALGALVLVLAGCGDGLVEVRGKVTYNGKPVENGTITFEPEDRSGPSRGQAIEAGAYHLTGPNRLTPGPKTVRIQGFGPTGRKVSTAPGSKQMVDEMGQYIPAKYNDKSTLKATVEDGKPLDFDLKP